MKRLDGLLMLGLWLTALAIRLPYLTLIPRYADEGVELLWGLDIALGRHLPLTSLDPYNGPIFPYLMAAIFRGLGVALLWPRLTMALAGATLVVVVYWLAWRMGGRVAGLLAASLTLTHPILVTFTSHVATPSSLTPLLAMLTAATAWEGVQRRSLAWLAAMGLCAALTLQSHPTSAAGLVGLALWLVAQPALRRPLHPPAFVVPLGMFLVGYAPMLLANLYPASAMLTAAGERPYAFAAAPSLSDYLTRLLAWGRYMVYAIGGSLPPGEAWMRLMTGLAALLLLVGLVYATLRGLTLIPAIFMTTALLLPLVVYYQSSRYMGGLLPLAHVALGIVEAFLIRVGHTRRYVGYGALGLWGVWLGLSSATIITYYQDTWANGWTNAGYDQLYTAINQQGACGDSLGLAQASMSDIGFPASDEDRLLHLIHYYLTMQRCQYTLLPPGSVPPPTATSLAWLIAPADAQPRLAPHWQPVLTVPLPTLSFTHLSVALYGRPALGSRP